MNRRLQPPDPRRQAPAQHGGLSRSASSTTASSQPARPQTLMRSASSGPRGDPRKPPSTPSSPQMTSPGSMRPSSAPRRAPPSPSSPQGAGKKMAPMAKKPLPGASAYAAPAKPSQYLQPGSTGSSTSVGSRGKLKSSQSIVSHVTELNEEWGEFGDMNLPAYSRSDCPDRAALRHELWCRVDIDGDGLITEEEFLRLVTHLTDGFEEREIRRMYNNVLIENGHDPRIGFGEQLFTDLLDEEEGFNCSDEKLLDVLMALEAESNAMALGRQDQHMQDRYMPQRSPGEMGTYDFSGSTAQQYETERSRRQVLERQLAELRNENERGRQSLNDLDNKIQNLRAEVERQRQQKPPSCASCKTVAVQVDAAAKSLLGSAGHVARTLLRDINADRAELLETVLRYVEPVKHLDPDLDGIYERAKGSVAAHGRTS